LDWAGKGGDSSSTYVLMQKPETLESKFVEPDEANTSLEDLAAYLRGVADATVALSQPPRANLAFDVEIHPARNPATPLDETEGSPVSSGRTMPYAGHCGQADTVSVPRTVVAPLFQVLTGGRYVDDFSVEPFVDERSSDLRLRAGQLSPESYGAVRARAR
jgi:hypothetical protein